nr:glutamate receptor ionotropic kainate 1 2 3 [Hymenolepis microstoma]
MITAICVITLVTSSTALQLNVGVILEGADHGKADAFQKAIFSANERLKKTIDHGSQEMSLNMTLRYIEMGDSFGAAEATCQLLSEGVVAVFGPDSPTTSAQSQWICQTHQVPYFLAQWNPLEILDDVADEYGDNSAAGLFNYTINLHPTHNEVGDALVDFLHKAEEWPQLGFIYSHDDSKHPRFY